MQKMNFTIGHVPAILLGEPSENVLLFLHGKCGCKEEAEAFSEIACPMGYQVLAVDLPMHGERKAEKDGFDPWHAVPELQSVFDYAAARWKTLGLRANSIGCYFSMLAFANKELSCCLFVSPILDMEALICGMMAYANVTEAELEEKKEIETPFGETLSWEYLRYARSHRITHWDAKTAILYAGQDGLTARSTAEAFSEKFHCRLNVMEDGEHWFHTEEQLSVLKNWEKASLDAARR